MFTQDELIAKLRKHEIKEIAIPEWGDDATIHIRSMSGAQREEIEEILMKNKTKDLRALVFVHSVCDENGNLMFKKNDIGMLNEGDGKVLDRVFHAAVKLNKMSEEEIAEAKKN